MEKRHGAVLLECNAISGTKVKISPLGEFSGIDGRKYFLDAESVIANMRNIGTDIMLDKNHEDNEAMGWFALSSLEIREDGVYAELTTNSMGENLVKERIYRYLSPAYSCSGIKNNAYIVERIASVGLVNRPNVLFSALNNEGDTNMEDMAKLKEQIQGLLSENEALKKRLEELQKDKEEFEANALKEKIEGAIERGEMLPARKEAALALNSVALSSFLDVCREEAKHVLSNKSLNLNAQSGEEELDSSIKEQLGL